MNTETEYDPNAVGQSVSEGEIPSMADMADEPSQGAWKAGWYKANIVEGYATRKGTQFSTSDVLSKAGDSRNLRICLAVQSKDGKETRNLQDQFNYRPQDLDATYRSHIKEARVEFKGVQKWPGAAADLQRSSIAIGQLGQFEKAIGFAFRATDVGINPQPLVSHSVDVRLGTDENGFNDVREYAKVGEGGVKK